MHADRLRSLVVVADDFGIGPATSTGILDLARKGVLSATVLLVNSPFAEASVASWQMAGAPVVMGWHPNLTLDRPILPPDLVPSLVRRDGAFWPLGAFLKKLFLGRINLNEVVREWQAQYRRFLDLVGQAPAFVNSHQHVSVFPAIGSALLHVLEAQRPRPYVRRVREPWSMLWATPGARKKRAFLNVLGRRMSQRQRAAGFPGNDWLAGVTDPPWLRKSHFIENWLRAIPGDVVELACHPGFPDETLVGRDCRANDGLMQRRVDEMLLLSRPGFLATVAEMGFEVMSPRCARESELRRSDAA